MTRPARPRLAGIAAVAVAVALWAGAARAETSVPCLIEPSRTSKLATPVAGVLARVLVDRGDAVHPGMLVAELTTSLEEAELASAQVKASDRTTIDAKQARRDFTSAKLARLQRLRGSAQLVSPTTLEEADSDARTAQAELEAAQIALKLAAIDVLQAEARLAQRRIFSPVEGIVTERMLTAGEYGYEQQPVVTVAETGVLNVEAFLPVGLFRTVRIGETVQVHPEAPIGGDYAATLKVVDQVMDAKSATFGIRAQLHNPQAALPAGIRCVMTFSG